VSAAHSTPVRSGNFGLLGRTAFGFRSILQWPVALQRTAFFLIASTGEFLAASRLFGWLVSGLAQGVSFILTLLTPHAAADLDNEPHRERLRIVVMATILAAVIISLGGNAIFTWLAGTFAGHDPHRYYYAHDKHNLIMYAIVAPAYMAASAAIIYCALSSFSLTDRTAYQRALPGRVWPIVRLGFVLSGIVLVSGLVQVNYFEDNIMGLAKADPASLKPGCRDRVFWFVDEISGGGGVRLNSAGVYYLCMQFSHMAIIAAAVWFMITAMFAMYRLGLDLTPEFLTRNGGAAPVRTKLKRFSLLEVSAKWLALILTVHIYIWGDSCLKGAENIRVTAMVLLALQFFVLATPRLLIEYRLLKCAAIDPESIGSEIEWPNLIDQRDRVMSTGVSCCHFVVQLALALLIGKLFTIAVG
jgi:hypothetical protein